MAQPARETLTPLELTSLFPHGSQEERFMSLATAEEYLSIVLYIVQRNTKEADNR